MFCTLKNKTPKTNLLTLFSFLGDFGKIPNDPYVTVNHNTLGKLPRHR